MERPELGTEGMEQLYDDRADLSGASKDVDDLLHLLMAPRDGTVISVKCLVEALLVSADRTATATIVEIRRGGLELEVASEWSPATVVELELQPLDELTISVRGVVTAVTGTSLQIELMPTHGKQARRQMRRFMLEAIRGRILDRGR